MTGLSAPSAARPRAGLAELAPAGVLRVAIAVGTARSALWAVRNSETGQAQGVTVDLAEAMATWLAVPLELVVYASSSEIVNAARRGDWDVAFVPVDEERKTLVHFGPNYTLAESSALVPAGSLIRQHSELNRKGIRIAGVDGTATFGGACRAFPAAIQVSAKSPDRLTALLSAGEVDAIVLGRDTLEGLVAKLPGTRILPGAFHAAGIAIALPQKGNPGFRLAEEFIEQAKSSGMVRKSLEAHGLKASVAPAGSYS